MNNVINNIISGLSIDEIYNYAINRLFLEGPTSTTVLEILTYLKIFTPDYFADKESDVLEIMGIFYKNLDANTIMV